jgi:hypothetical protein
MKCSVPDHPPCVRCQKTGRECVFPQVDPTQPIRRRASSTSKPRRPSSTPANYLLQVSGPRGDEGSNSSSPQGGNPSPLSSHTHSSGVYSVPSWTPVASAPSGNGQPGPPFPPVQPNAVFAVPQRNHSIPYDGGRDDILSKRRRTGDYASQSGIPLEPISERDMTQLIEM